MSQAHRVTQGLAIAEELHNINPLFERLPVGRTTEEKMGLCALQIAEGREGEVWFREDMPYFAGKTNDERFVRTKYLTEFIVKVTGLQPTTAEGKLFGAIEIADANGRPLGKIGTGFSRADEVEIAEQFSKGDLYIECVSQGYTEGGIVWHGRYSRIVEPVIS